MDADVVVRGGSTISYLRSSADGLARLSCGNAHVDAAPDEAMAVGDFDGNGRADVAIESAGTVSMLLTL